MRPITFLSDYGSGDDFVGVCHAVMARLAPGCRIVDLTHGIPPHDVRAGALTLRRSLPFTAPGVHLAVVDPEVGGERRGVALRTAEDDRLLVGPDNGLLSLAAQRFGGVVEAVDLARSPHRLPVTSATFHGRDIFSPVTAALAAGEPLAAAGDPLDADEITKLDMPLAGMEGDTLVCHVIGFDRFGNVMLDVEHEELDGSGLRMGRRYSVAGREVPFGRTFADVPAGELLLYEDAYRTLSLALNRGSARELLGLAVDDELRIAPA